MDKTIEQRIVVAAPSQLRQMAREGMASHVPDEAAQTTGPGSGDGGTTTSPPAGISLPDRDGSEACSRGGQEAQGAKAMTERATDVMNELAELTAELNRHDLALGELAQAEQDKIREAREARRQG